MTLYHGSSTPDLKVLEPRIRFTPGSLGKRAPEAIYAGDEPAYAATHGFPWSSKEGFDVVYENGKVVLIVPEAHRERLLQPLFVYEVPGDGFELLDTEPKGHNYWTRERIVPVRCVRYETVTDAVERNGGSIRYI
jgi:hypothetical protein